MEPIKDILSLLFLWLLWGLCINYPLGKLWYMAKWQKYPLIWDTDAKINNFVLAVMFGPFGTVTLIGMLIIGWIKR